MEVEIDLAISQKRVGTFCLGCFAKNASEDHPLFQGKICKTCIERIKKSVHNYGEDGISYCCVLCGFPGSMLVCSDLNCGKSYCDDCIEYFTLPGFKSKVLKSTKWLCFFCKDHDYGGLISARDDWKRKITKLFELGNTPLVKVPELPRIKRKIRVLSLFDGIASGFLALEKLKVSIDAYYSCEIDNDALTIVRSNFSNRITLIGNVEDLSEEKLQSFLPIDLLIAGSPCNDLSLANPKRKGLYDFSGTGVLFFEFYRILCILRTINKKPFFWMFENVASMPLEWRSKISRFLQCEPAVFDAVNVSPQNRPRLFWGNLPTLQAELPDTDRKELQSYLRGNRRAAVPKLRTVTTNANSLLQGPNSMRPVIDDFNREDTLWITELEKIFGFPEHYTDCGKISPTKRQKLIGKSWSIPVISFLFQFLPDYFMTSENGLSKARRSMRF